MTWKNYTVAQLKEVAVKYNKLHKIPGVAKLKRDELIKVLETITEFKGSKLHVKAIHGGEEIKVSGAPTITAEYKSKIELADLEKKSAMKKKIKAQAEGAKADAAAIKSPFKTIKLPKKTVAPTPPEENKVEYLKGLLREVDSEFSKYHILDILRSAETKKKVYDLSHEIAKASGAEWFAISAKDIQNEKAIRDWLQSQEYTGFRTVSRLLQKKIAQAEGKELPPINLTLLKERLFKNMRSRFDGKKAEGNLKKFINEKVKTNKDFYRLVNAFSSSDAMGNDTISVFGRDLTEIFKNQTLAYDEYEKHRTTKDMAEEDNKEVRAFKNKNISV
jgi:hypothetical protein